MKDNKLVKQVEVIVSSPYQKLIYLPNAVKDSKTIVLKLKERTNDNTQDWKKELKYVGDNADYIEEIIEAILDKLSENQIRSRGCDYLREKVEQISKWIDEIEQQTGDNARVKVYDSSTEKSSEAQNDTKIIELTPKQVEVVSWAFGGMEGMDEQSQKELWGFVDNDDKFRQALDDGKLDIRKFRGGQLDDLIYRLQEQWCDMAEGEFGEGIEYSNTVRPALNVVKKVQEAV